MSTATRLASTLRSAITKTRDVAATAAAAANHRRRSPKRLRRAEEMASSEPPAPKVPPAPPPMAGKPAFFPLSYRDTVSQWWASIHPLAAERAVLNFVPYLREASTSAIDLGLSASSSSSSHSADPHGNRLWRKTQVPLPGTPAGRFLNEYSVERAGENATAATADDQEALVMIHGYGAGLGFFYKNFEPLSRVPGWKLYALDMLGMGNSARPPWRISAKEQDAKIDEAESWFIDSLEEWRKARKLDRFTLMGHSLGGYMAVEYALKYPGRLKKLILVSPVGIPEDPWAVQAAMPEPGDSTVASEFIQDQESIVQHSAESSQSPPAQQPRPIAAAATSAQKQQQPPNSAPQRRKMPSWFTWLWDANVSPFSIVRYAGPLGPRFVSGWTSRRFNHLPTDEARALHDYAFSIFRQKGSGEYALPYILAPGAYARRPLLHRIQNVGRRPLPSHDGGPAKKETGIPIVIMYGEHDWMDVAGGLAAEEKLKQTRAAALASASEEERRAENGSAKVVIVPKAGHHLYIDNSEQFNQEVVKELEQTRDYERRRRAGGD